jgi:predicted transglutaminase-like cysteine proteinase
MQPKVDLFVGVVLVLLVYSEALAQTESVPESEISTIRDVDQDVNWKVRPTQERPTRGYSWHFSPSGSLTPPSDQENDKYIYQNVEERGDGKGNCTTYVATKREELLRKGISPEAMGAYEVRLPDGELHAVLQVNVINSRDNSTDEYILDNRSKRTKTRKEVEDEGYKFIRQVPNEAFTSNR